MTYDNAIAAYPSLEGLDGLSLALLRHGAILGRDKQYQAAIDAVMRRKIGIM